MLFGLDNYYYHGSVRRYVALFGSIFSDIYIKRVADDGSREEIIQIPIKYGSGNMYMKAAQDETRETKKYARILPSIAFELTNIYKDVDRKTNSLNRIKEPTFNANSQKNYQLNRVPYNLLFELNIRTKNTDDMLQITEQVIPAFDSNLSVTIEDTTGLKVEQDIILKLEEIVISDNYDDEMASRLIEWKITFEMKGYLYKKTNTAYVIKEIDLIDGYTFYDNLIDTVTTQPPITEEQNTISSMTDAFNSTASTPVKKTTRRKKGKE